MTVVVGPCDVDVDIHLSPRGQSSSYRRVRPPKQYIPRYTPGEFLGVNMYVGGSELSVSYNGRTLPSTRKPTALHSNAITLCS